MRGLLTAAGAVAVAATLMSACGQQGSQSAATPGAAGESSAYPQVGKVEVADGVRVEYRDYGGDGPPIVLLSGLGNSAAVYDDLAPRLTDSHRVIALTRRGFGNSSSTADGYDVSTRVADDLAALDALGIDQALLVGHSIAGDELTGIAKARPSLPTGLVYLDSALDRTASDYAASPECGSLVAQASAGAVDLLQPDEVTEGGGDLQITSMSAQQRLSSASLGGSVPMAEVLSQNARTPQGWIVGIDTQAATAAIQKGSETTAPDYAGIKVPVTALYSDWADAAASFPLSTSAPTEVQKGLQKCAAATAAWAENSAAQVRAAVPDAQIEIVPGAPHYLFLQQPELTADRILSTAKRAQG